VVNPETISFSFGELVPFVVFALFSFGPGRGIHSYPFRGHKPIASAEDSENQIRKTNTQSETRCANQAWKWDGLEFQVGDRFFSSGNQNIRLLIHDRQFPESGKNPGMNLCPA